MQKIADVKFSAAVLQWDQETYLPPKGAEFRGRQLATLSEIAHEWFIDPQLGQLLEELHSRHDLQDDQQRNVALSLEDYNKQKKFTPAFIRQLSEASSRCFHSWLQARSANSFALFSADLEHMVQLKKEEAQLAGYKEHPYNALLDQYEKGATVALLDRVFTEVRQPLKDLLGRIAGGQSVDDRFLRQDYPKQKQWDFGMELIRRMGFDFDAGRQDISEHPFTTNFNSLDVRITTRIDEHDFNHMTWSCIHETGHALYEQGLSADYYGLPLGEFASLGIHESQSRLWENNVGRSYNWWQAIYPRLQRVFPTQLSDVSLQQFYRAINKVQPSLIRTEADEVSYHFHVMIRYELEKRLIEGSLAVADIPAWWNEHYAAWLGVTVPDDKRGCLQDVHWSHGSFGYFPTYSLGSFYAAQFFAAAENQLPGLHEAIGAGNTAPLLAWLRENIHRWGRRYTSEELCQKATGKTLEIRYFLDYLLDKYVNIYKF
ncbi:carboxypeptidase M32 [Puia dinghuensis]|uniref:Metal-dependent carboxypeptidase n=1 Tax=Puia dinghuensis TaxID=1792502 RepID=A0A8J2UHG6_9BACT|nr:carboxypeptidase M32 [Puia dinghuensis]GGB16253.1 carboxypeptidase Taq [Puia dinghuensis]